MKNQRVLIGYDIRCKRRLQRVHRRISKHCWMLQESVYLGYQPAHICQKLEREIRQLVESEDDMRLYSLHRNQHVYWWGGDVVMRGVQWFDQPRLVQMREPTSRSEKLLMPNNRLFNRHNAQTIEQWESADGTRAESGDAYRAPGK